MAEDVQNTIINLEDEGNELEEIITTNPTLDPEELTKELDDLLLKWESEDQPSQEKFEEYSTFKNKSNFLVRLPQFGYF